MSSREEDVGKGPGLGKLLVCARLDWTTMAGSSGPGPAVVESDMCGGPLEVVV